MCVVWEHVCRASACVPLSMSSRPDISDLSPCWSSPPSTQRTARVEGSSPTGTLLHAPNIAPDRCPEVSVEMLSWPPPMSLCSSLVRSTSTDWTSSEARTATRGTFGLPSYFGLNELHTRAYIRQLSS
jgi:hypothetical protein